MARLWLCSALRTAALVIAAVIGAIGLCVIGLSSWQPAMYKGIDNLTDGPSDLPHRLADGVVAQRFVSWLSKHLNTTSPQPFFTFIYFQLQHYPRSETMMWYLESLGKFDQALQMIFGALEDHGVLENTIIFGSGDHGVNIGLTKPTHGRISYFPGKPPSNVLDPWFRNQDADATVIHVPTWAHIPQHLFPSPNALHNFVVNQDRTVSTIDLGATFRSIAGLRHYTAKERETCIVGYDLLAAEVPRDRVAVGWHIEPSIAIFSANDTVLFWLREVCGKTRQSLVLDHFGEQQGNTTYLAEAPTHLRRAWQHSIRKLELEQPAFMKSRAKLLNLTAHLDCSELPDWTYQGKKRRSCAPRNSITHGPMKNWY